MSLSQVRGSGKALSPRRRWAPARVDACVAAGRRRAVVTRYQALARRLRGLRTGKFRPLRVLCADHRRGRRVRRRGRLYRQFPGERLVLVVHRIQARVECGQALVERVKVARLEGVLVALDGAFLARHLLRERGAPFGLRPPLPAEGA